MALVSHFGREQSHPFAGQSNPVFPAVWDSKLAYYAAFEFKYGRKDFADCHGAIDNLSLCIYANVLENYGKLGN